MNQDTSKGHPEGATPALGLDRPTVVYSVGSRSNSPPFCSNFNTSSTASDDRGCLPQSNTLTHSQHVRGPTTPDNTYTTERAPVTPMIQWAPVAHACPRAALSAPGTIHSVSREPLNPAPGIPGIQPTGWQAYAPPDLPSAAAIRPPSHAQAFPMELFVDAWSVPDSRATPPAPTEPLAQGTSPSSSPAPPVRTTTPVATQPSPHPIWPTALPVASSPHPEGTAALAMGSPHPPRPYGHNAGRTLHCPPAVCTQATAPYTHQPHRHTAASTGPPPSPPLLTPPSGVPHPGWQSSHPPTHPKSGPGHATPAPHPPGVPRATTGGYRGPIGPRGGGPTPTYGHSGAPGPPRPLPGEGMQAPPHCGRTTADIRGHDLQARWGPTWPRSVGHPTRGLGRIRHPAD